MVGSSGSAWASHHFVGEGFGPSDFINPHDDGPWRFNGDNPDDDDDEQEHRNSQPNGDHAKVAVGVDSLAPYFGVLGSGVFGFGFSSFAPPRARLRRRRRAAAGHNRSRCRHSHQAASPRSRAGDEHRGEFAALEACQ